MTSAERRSLIEDSGYFDPAFYLARNPDVAGSTFEPFDHYVKHGADENRAATPKFDPRYYAAHCALKGIDPGNCLVHYLTQGRAGGLFATALDYTLHATGLPAAELAGKFASWGRDCEFGFVQRALGAEPNDLFRFSNPTPEVLIKLISEGFTRYGEQCHIALDEQKPRGEWFFVDHETRTSRHSGIYDGDMPKERVQGLARTWTRMLREKAAREFAEASRIYVIKTSQGDLTEDAVAEVAKAVRAKGPGWLMWVEAGDPVGRCEVAMDGLLRARIDRLCVRGREHEFSLAGWLDVMCAAWNEIAKHPSAGGRPSPA